MAYVERILGDNERVQYSTHQHAIVLFQRIILWFLTFALFLGVGLVILLWPEGDQGTKIRWWIGLVALVSVLVPVSVVVLAWRGGRRGRSLLRRIWLPILAGALLLTLAVVMMFKTDWSQFGWIAMAMSIVPLVGLVRGFLSWVNERYIITNRRVMEVKGVVNKHVRDSALEKVNDVDLRQSFVGRIVRYGTVQIITGSDIGVNMFRRISNPVKFKCAMLNAKENLHRSELPFVGPEPATAVTTPDPASSGTSALPVDRAQIPDLIAELAELHQQGALSQQEFENKKRELLDRL